MCGQGVTITLPGEDAQVFELACARPHDDRDHWYRDDDIRLMWREADCLVEVIDAQLHPGPRETRLPPGTIVTRV